MEGFVENGGYIDTLLTDRGYIDGPTLTHYKKDYRINWVIPLKKSMAAYDDVIGLCWARNVDWKSYGIEYDSNGFVAIKEEVASFFNIGTWENLSVPLHVSVKRTTDYFSGKISYFVLAMSKRYKYPDEAFDLYKKRTCIEERHRQLKGFWDLAKFSSPTFSLVLTRLSLSLSPTPSCNYILLDPIWPSLPERPYPPSRKRKGRESV